MANLVPSNFCRYELSLQEEKQGNILTIENIYVIQNMIANRAQEKIELASHKQTYEEYWQREAELQGEINVLSLILTNHRTVLENLEYSGVPNEVDSTSYGAASAIFDAQSE